MRRWERGGIRENGDNKNRRIDKDSAALRRDRPRRRAHVRARGPNAGSGYREPRATVPRFSPVLHPAQHGCWDAADQWTRGRSNRRPNGARFTRRFLGISQAVWGTKVRARRLPADGNTPSAAVTRSRS
ncbi:hypothetical protein GWI33_002917 [Rhynchophorus ferrugineus]|uniref:Uncharacterized protein n=1 Tax=Rhynchophorus ferrugineus TaxID=354439 RepID=A0A834IQN4_RHYFE|nr:hypothetical protein GWI33_002917 [Rhynchophorus ferrugineus]